MADTSIAKENHLEIAALVHCENSTLENDCNADAVNFSQSDSDHSSSLSPGYATPNEELSPITANLHQHFKLDSPLSSDKTSKLDNAECENTPVTEGESNSAGVNESLCRSEKTLSNDKVASSETDGKTAELQSSKLSIDEDAESPAFTPRNGRFFEHDDRSTDSQAASLACKTSVHAEACEMTRSSSDAAAEASPKLIETQRHGRANAESRWTHDLFDSRQQKPKSSRKLSHKHGNTSSNEFHRLPKENKDEQFSHCHSDLYYKDYDGFKSKQTSHSRIHLDAKARAFRRNGRSHNGDDLLINEAKQLTRDEETNVGQFTRSGKHRALFTKYDDYENFYESNRPHVRAQEGHRFTTVPSGYFGRNSGHHSHADYDEFLVSRSKYAGSQVRRTNSYYDEFQNRCRPANSSRSTRLADECNHRNDSSSRKVAKGTDRSTLNSQQFTINGDSYYKQSSRGKDLKASQNVGANCSDAGNEKVTASIAVENGNLVESAAPIAGEFYSVAPAVANTPQGVVTSDQLNVLFDAFSAATAQFAPDVSGQILRTVAHTLMMHGSHSQTYGSFDAGFASPTGAELYHGTDSNILPLVDVPVPVAIAGMPTPISVASSPYVPAHVSVPFPIPAPFGATASHQPQLQPQPRRVRAPLPIVHPNDAPQSEKTRAAIQ